MTGYEKSPDYGGDPRMPWGAVIIAIAIIALLFFLFTAPVANAGSFNEHEIQACACAGMELEVKTGAGTRIDCLSDTYAIEVEATKDWAEAIGQSLHYASESGKKAKVLFFCEDAEDACFRHELAFRSTVAAHNLPIEWEYVPDTCAVTPDSPESSLLDHKDDDMH